MTPVREQVVQKIMQRLNGITAVPVLRCESYEDEAEFVCVWDLDQDSTKTPYGKTEHIMAVVVEFLKDSSTTPSAAATGMYAAILERVFKNASDELDTSLDGTAIRMSETGFTPIIPDAGLKVVGASVRLEVVFETATGNPFA